MKEYPVSKRIMELRERAMGAVKSHKMIYGDYGWDYRQMLLFYEGWIKFNAINCDDDEAPTTLMRRSCAEVYMFDNLPITIFEEDKFLGMPDIVGLDEDEHKRFIELDYWYKKFAYRVPGRIDHMSPDYDKLIRIGIEGVLEEISENRKKIADLPYSEWIEKTEYYDMCEMQLNAVLRLAQRYVQKARSMGMTEAADRLDRVPRGPAKTFHDALQSIHFFSLNLRGLYQFGHPDRTLINLYRQDINNGTLTEEEALEGFFELTEEDWDTTFDTNLKSVYFLSREAASLMIEKKINGSIINICSNTGYYQTTMAYGTSKWGERGLTMGLGHRLARYGIRVNGIAPGPTSTRLMFANDGETVNKKEIPIGRYSYPEEIAELAAFLADDNANNIIGQVIIADGGELSTL